MDSFNHLRVFRLREQVFQRKHRGAFGWKHLTNLFGHRVGGSSGHPLKKPLDFVRRKRCFADSKNGV